MLIQVWNMPFCKNEDVLQKYAKAGWLNPWLVNHQWQWTAVNQPTKWHKSLVIQSPLNTHLVYSPCHINCIHFFKLILHLKGTMLKMEIDIRAAVSIIGDTTRTATFKTSTPTNKVKLWTYTRESIPVY